MAAVMKIILNKIDFYLYRKGFTEPMLRGAIAALLWLSAVSLAVGLLWLAWGSAPLMFAVGCLIMTWNFWSLSQFVFQHFSGQYSRELIRGQILRFLLRFGGSGVVLAVCLASGGSSWALGSGLVASLLVMLAGALVSNRNT